MAVCMDIQRNEYQPPTKQDQSTVNKESIKNAEADNSDVDERRYACDKCKKTYKHKYHLNEHKKEIHKSLVSCRRCGQYFNRTFALRRHEVTCKKEKTVYRDTNEETMNKKTENVEIQDEDATEKEALSQPQPVDTEQISDDKTQKRINTLTVTDFVDPPSDSEDIIIKHWSSIRSHTFSGKIQDVCNIRLTDPHLSDILNAIFENQDSKFKANYSFGLLLRNTMTEELRYYHSSQNNARVLEFPKLITNADDWKMFTKSMLNEDILEWARQQRPDTKWTVQEVTNVTLFLNKISKHAIGHRIILPDFIVNNPAIITLNKDENHGFFYEDNLCFYRCVALHFGASTHTLQTATKQMFAKCTGKVKTSDFPGVKLDELPAIEDKLEINIMVYKLINNDDQDNIVHLVQRSQMKYKSTMYLNLFDRHFSYIKDMKLYSNSYQCRTCDKLWPNAYLLQRHEQTCDDRTKYQYPGGVYHPAATVFEKLELEGINIQTEL